MTKEQWFDEHDRRLKEAADARYEKWVKDARDKDYLEYQQRSGERTLVKF